MARLPNAILFDLDDTIICAYARADLAWAAVLVEFTGTLASLHDLDVMAAIMRSATSSGQTKQRH